MDWRVLTLLGLWNSHGPLLRLGGSYGSLLKLGGFHKPLLRLRGSHGPLPGLGGSHGSLLRMRELSWNSPCRAEGLFWNSPWTGGLSWTSLDKTIVSLQIYFTISNVYSLNIS